MHNFIVLLIIWILFYREIYMSSAIVKFENIYGKVLEIEKLLIISLFDGQILAYSLITGTLKWSISQDIYQTLLYTFNKKDNNYTENYIAALDGNLFRVKNNRFYHVDGIYMKDFDVHPKNTVRSTKNIYYWVIDPWKGKLKNFTKLVTLLQDNPLDTIYIENTVIERTNTNIYTGELDWKFVYSSYDLRYVYNDEFILNVDIIKQFSKIFEYDYVKGVLRNKIYNNFSINVPSPIVNMWLVFKGFKAIKIDIRDYIYFNAPLNINSKEDFYFDYVLDFYKGQPIFIPIKNKSTTFSGSLFDNLKKKMFKIHVFEKSSQHVKSIIKPTALPKTLSKNLINRYLVNSVNSSVSMFISDDESYDFVQHEYYVKPFDPKYTYGECDEFCFNDMKMSLSKRIILYFSNLTINGYVFISSIFLIVIGMFKKIISKLGYYFGDNPAKSKTVVNVEVLPPSLNNELTVASTLPEQVPSEKIIFSKYEMEYDHLSVIGSGGFGHVFCAVHKISHTKYAIKRIRSMQCVLEQAFVDNEIKALSHINHINVTRYFYVWREETIPETTSDGKIIYHSLCSKLDELEPCDSIKSYDSELNTSHKSFDDGIPSRYTYLAKDHSNCRHEMMIDYFISMELCKKETLDDWIKMGLDQRPTYLVASYFLQILEGVNAVHKAGFIHRDIKPSNILFGFDNCIKIADLGLVSFNSKGLEMLIEEYGQHESLLKQRITDKFQNNSLRQRTLGVGTDIYMAPEIRKCEKYDSVADTYSIGIILYQMLTPDCTIMELNEKIINIRDKDIFDFKFEENKDYAIFKQLLQWMLNPDPKNRPEIKDILKCTILSKVIELLQTNEEILNDKDNIFLSENDEEVISEPDE